MTAQVLDQLPQSQWLLITINVVKKTVIVNCNCPMYFFLGLTNLSHVLVFL